MKLRKFRYTVLPALMMITSNLYTQFSGSNLFELQTGNIPHDEPAMLISNYNQLNLKYRYKGFRVSGRLEYFINKYPERRYVNPSQLQLQYKTKSLTFKAGNYYDMLGNGLLLRAYDIPAAVFESQGYRVRHGFYRDLLGFSGKYTGKVFHLKAIYGKSLVNQLPPTLNWKERRTEDIYAINPGFRIGQQNIDLNYLYSKSSSDSHHYSSLHVTGNLPFNLTYNVEMAVELGTGIPVFSGSGSTHALYASLVYSGMKAGGILEWKDYRNFQLGSGFNDPPTLVKEHSYKVLNRSTHLPLLMNERGFQAEFYYRFDDGKMLTLNTARARNELHEVFIFHEYLVELFSPVGESASLKWFADYARDPFENESHRFSGGGIFETSVSGTWSTLAEVEYQYIKRGGFLPGGFHNAVLMTGFSRGTRFSAGLTLELSTDPFMTDVPATFEIERETRYWLGADLKFRINNKHTFTVFGGQRRGGPACTSGICYEVLDFTGIELRITSRF